MDEEQDEKLQLHEFKTDSLTGDTVLNSPVRTHSANAGLLTEDTGCSEQTFTEETELTLTDISTNANKKAESPDDSNLKSTVARPVSICSLNSVETVQPKPLCDLLYSSTLNEVSQSVTSISRTQESLKTKNAHNAADNEDLCATILLACLFCHPLDCLLATARGCNECMWSLCSSLCGCESTTLHPLMDITQHCDLCSCLGARCFMCDCPVCDVCLQATECLDLAMEISQMLYH